MSESETLKTEEPLIRSREALDEEREKKNAYQRAYNKRKRAEKKAAVVDAKTGLDSDELAEMDRARNLAEAEARIKEAAISEDNRLMVYREVKVDVFNTRRFYVELTPSMCDVRNCPFDAAIEAKCAGWADAPVDQVMSDGKTFGDRLIQMKDYHKATAHTARPEDDHIITAGELNKRQWSIGNKAQDKYLK